MHTYSIEEIKEKISTTEIQAIRIIYLAMFIGILFLLIAFYFLATNSTTVQENINQSIFYLLAFLIIIIYVIFLNYEKFFLNQKRINTLMEKRKITDNYDWMFEKMIARTIIIIKVTFLEIAALIGCIALYLSARADVFQHSKLAWIFILPAIIHFMYIMMAFPNKDSLALFIYTRFYAKN